MFLSLLLACCTPFLVRSTGLALFLIWTSLLQAFPACDGA